MNISIVGGDLRIVRLAEMYAKEKEINNIYTYGLEKYFEKNLIEINKNSNEDNCTRKKYEVIDENIKICNTLEETIESSDVIISGMPFTKDNININSPFSKQKITINEISKLLSGKTFVAGGIPKDLCDDEKINTIDLLKNEELTILNAIPTVEGTIKIAIEEREETIHESNVLICGFGRIGKILCDRFSNLGANIYCSARKETDLAWIREKRYIPLKYDELNKYSSEFDIVINTVPTIVIDKKELEHFRKDVLIIDLASSPGGINKEYAKGLGIKVITALGIPGKEMPRTAGKYIKDIINKILMLH